MALASSLCLLAEPKFGLMTSSRASSSIRSSLKGYLTTSFAELMRKSTDPPSMEEQSASGFWSIHWVSLLLA